MAVKWKGEVPCRWCGWPARAGVEKDGEGRTYRVMCPKCGVVSQIAFRAPAGERIALQLAAGAYSSYPPADVADHPALASGLDGPPLRGIFKRTNGQVWFVEAGGICHPVCAEMAADLRLAEAIDQSARA